MTRNIKELTIVIIVVLFIISIALFFTRTLIIDFIQPIGSNFHIQDKYCQYTFGESFQAGSGLTATQMNCIKIDNRTQEVEVKHYSWIAVKDKYCDTYSIWDLSKWNRRCDFSELGVSNDR